MRKKITKRSVEAITPGPKDQKLWDTEIPGFGVKVTPADRRVYVLQYWAPGRARARRTFTLGVHGAPVVHKHRTVDLTAELARELAREARADIQRGADPAGDRGQARAALKTQTVAALSLNFLEAAREKRKATTATEYARLFDKHLVPAFGAVVVDAITVRDVSALHHKMRKTPMMANRCVALLGAFLNWCALRGFRPRGTNPCRDVEMYEEHARERFLSVEELARLGDALRTAETAGLPPAPQHRRKPPKAETAKHRPKMADTPLPANPYAVAALRLLLLTGWRKDEVLTLRWDAVDLTRGGATLANTKTGKSERALGLPAVALLKALPRVEGSPFVFPGAKPGKSLREIRRVWTAARLAAKLTGVRLHDIRHTAASHAISGGVSLYVTGKLLGHKRAATTQRYAHLSDDVVKRAADETSSTINAALEGHTVHVVPLRLVTR